MNGWKNPLCSPWHEKRVRKAISADLKRAHLTKCKLVKLKPAYTPHITRAISFETITMATEVQER